MLAHAVRHEKFGILGPAVAALGETDFLLAERLAVGGAGVVLVRCAVADMTVDDDQRRRIGDLPEPLDGLRQPLPIVGVADVLHVPTVGEETCRDIVAESQIRVPFDRYPVAVVDPAKVAEHLLTCKRGRFACDTFHHVAVAAHDVDVVIENLEIWPIKAVRQPASRERHTHAVAAALAQRTGRRLDTRCQSVFRMARTFAVELTKPLDILERDCEFG